METQGNWENWFRHVGSDWDKVVLVRSGPALRGAQRQVARRRSPARRARTRGTSSSRSVKRGAAAMPESMTEANVIKAMRQEFVSFDTDMGPAGAPPTPGSTRAATAPFRASSAATSATWACSRSRRAVQRMTAVAANELMLYDRGRLAPGPPPTSSSSTPIGSAIAPPSPTQPAARRDPLRPRQRPARHRGRQPDRRPAGSRAPPARHGDPSGERPDSLTSESRGGDRVPVIMGDAYLGATPMTTTVHDIYDPPPAPVAWNPNPGRWFSPGAIWSVW